MDSLSICWLDLAFADIATRNLTKHWPFESYKSRTFVIEAADSTLQNIAFDLYSSKIPWSEGCLRSAMYFQQHGRFRDAATTYEALLEEYPTNYYSHYLLGFVYKEMGKFSNAIEHYSAAITYNSQYPYPRIDLGLLEINKGRIDDAIENFVAALRLVRGRNSRMKPPQSIMDSPRLPQTRGISSAPKSTSIHRCRSRLSISLHSFCEINS